MDKKKDNSGIKIFVINCGSSSIKFQLVDMSNEKVLAKGLVDRLGQPASIMKFSLNGKEFNKECNTLDHSSAISGIIDLLVDRESGIIEDKGDITAVGHRLVHGAEMFKQSVLIDDDTIKHIEACTDLAPLHNPHNLKGIYICRELLPGIPNVAVFDTAFHQTIPDYAYMYALDHNYYQKYGFRRYGFHGTSHFYVANKAAEIVGVDIDKLKIITCHLGNGASMTAVEFGRSIDTSMGFTPLEGLVMGTRCGDVDPAVALFIMIKEEITPEECDSVMNKKSGLIGISGISSDMRDILNAYNDGNERAELALKIYAYRIKKYIGMYAAVMNGVDIVVFTGGIGENAHLVRSMCCNNMEFIGIDFDEEKSRNTIGVEGELTCEGSDVKVLCIPTNEELVIARDATWIVSK